MDKLYYLDDTFQVSEEIEKMSDEERCKQARVWEEEGRKEREKIKERKILSVI